MTHQVIGTCGLCGGAVQVPTIFYSIVPPVPTCGSCGATQRSQGPVIEMEPPTPVQTTVTTTPFQWKQNKSNES